MKLVLYGRKIAEGIAGLMLAAMFATFLVQIWSRYVMVQPFGWTLELCTALWIWIVFWGGAFVVREKDHVTFDILYLAVPRRVRTVFALISAGSIAAALALAFWPTWDWIDFLKRKRSASLGVQMRTIYSVFGLFMVVVALRYAYIFLDVLRRGPHDEAHAVAHEAHDAADRPEELR